MSGKRGSSALKVVRMNGELMVSISDLVAAFAGLRDAGTGEQREAFATLHDTFAAMLQPQPPRRKVQGLPCQFCRATVVVLPVQGEDRSVTVEAFASPDGEWLPVELSDAEVQAVRYEPKLDGVGQRVRQHRCKR